MYHSNGNYEAFVHPRKPEGVESKSAYIVGTGLAGLSAAVFLVRDAQMPGENIRILEASPIAGGALDGAYIEGHGYCCRGGRELEAHMECLWDMFRSIPSLENPGMTVLDETYYLNKNDPNYSLERAIWSGGKSATTFDLTFSPRVNEQMQALMMTPEDELDDKPVSEFFDDEFFSTPFWLYYSTMFAFQKWHSALEFKRYCLCFAHHTSDIGGAGAFSDMLFMKYNQYESFVLPMLSYLEDHGVKVTYNTTVTDIRFDCRGGKKVATQITTLHDGKEETIALTENDFVFTTLGSNVENSTIGTHHTAPQLKLENGAGKSWALWKKIASQSDDFGHPDKFCGKVQESMFASATMDIDDAIAPYVEKISQRPLGGGRTGTGGIVSVKDSSWLISYGFDRQPHFKSQPNGHYVGWMDALNNTAPGDYIKKPMMECTGKEICEEWLYHIGVPVDQIEDLAENHANFVPCVMPYVTSYFEVRARGDRPKIVLDGAVNFGFMGEFVEIPRNVVFTTEYAVRSAMEAVYTLLKVDRGVPEVYGSMYDVRVLLKQMPQGAGAPQMPEGLAKQISETEDIGWKNTTAMEDYKKRGMI